MEGGCTPKGKGGHNRTEKGGHNRTEKGCTPGVWVVPPRGRGVWGVYPPIESEIKKSYKLGWRVKKIEILFI